MTATGRRRRLRPWRIARYLGIALALIVLAPALIVGVLVARVWLGQPELDGERLTPGLQAVATIDRDALGIVHIKAESEGDAYFALGFVHAQDRFFQMDAMRRIAGGRLSEIMGNPGLAIDQRMRRLGLARLAAGDVAHLPPEVRAVYERYRDGVNTWLKTRKGVAADELTLLLAGEPEPWTIPDSLAWNRLMALRLVGNWGSELMRLRLGRVLTPDQLADLWPEDQAGLAVSVPAPPQSVLDAAAGLADLVNPEDGSNAWALDGRLSASGHALLANDPHLGLTTPGVWHLVRLEAPGLLLAGATAPGVPAMVLGHNGHVAWGLTNAATDTSDLYVETVDPSDRDAYLTPDGPRPFERRAETIRVRFGADRTLTVLTTRHGPIITPADDDGPLLALAHTGFLEGERSAETLYRINRARTWTDVIVAARLTRGPQQNIFYAGPDGVGMAVGGLMPIRRSGDGYMPADGAGAAGDWVGFADVDTMPQTFQPAQGWVANANNQLAPSDYPIPLGREWGYPGRFAVIEQALQAMAAAGGGADADAMQALQFDNASPIARDLLPLMLATLDEAPLRQADAPLAAALRAWDGATPMAAAEPLIFFAWMREAMRTIFADEMQEAFEDWNSLRAEPLARILTRRPVWCDDVATDSVETCATALAESLTRAHVWLRKNYGDDPQGWHWGDAHQARFRHMAFGFIPVLNRIFDIRLPAPGAQETVNRAAFRIADGADPFGQGHGPSFRAIFDLAVLEAARMIAGPGQSGRLFSPNRSSMAENWRDGRYSALAPLQTPAHRLTLRTSPAQR